MIKALNYSEGTKVELFGNAIDIAAEFAAITSEINKKYPDVMEFATLLLKLDAMEELDD